LETYPSLKDHIATLRKELDGEEPTNQSNKEKSL